MSNIRASVCALALCSSLIACVELDDDAPVGHAADDLINGTLDGGYYHVVKVDAKCTGTLVGPRTVVTANHCRPGTIGGALAPVTVEGRVRVRVMDPEWGTWYWSEETFSVQGAFRSHPSLDVAVVVLDRAISGAAVARLASSTPVGGAIVMVGYGRSTTPNTSTNDYGRLRTGASRIESLSGARFYTSSTPGAPTLCNGDSGGPSLLGGAGSTCLVGIHSETPAGGCSAPGGIDVAAAGVASWIRAQTTDTIGGC